MGCALFLFYLKTNEYAIYSITVSYTHLDVYKRQVHTPADILDMAAAYIRVLFLGIPASMLYNYTASILRAVGDARHPFYFLVFSCFLNIGLDWLFIVPGGMGVGGAALALSLIHI